MVYNPNGFNFNGESITDIYNTDIAGEFTTKSSGFTQLVNGSAVDIATLITPAMTGGRGNTPVSNAYTGFGGTIDFDDAFSAQLPSKPLLEFTSATSAEDYDTYKSVEFRTSTTVDAITGNFKVNFSETLTGGSASTPGERYKPNVTMLTAIVGGGGSGGASSSFPGAGGGGGAAIKPLEFKVNNNTTMNIRVGSGGSSVKPHTYGKQGYPTVIWNDNTNDFYVEVPGGGGGGYFDGMGEILTYCGSTGGAGGEDENLNDAQYSHQLTLTGSQIHRYGTNDGTQITNGYTDWDSKRHRGGHDQGYGYAGGGGGGAGGIGRNHTGAHNRVGGAGGAGIELWGKMYCGGGGGSPDNNKQSGYGYGAGGSGGGGSATDNTSNTGNNNGKTNTGGGGGGGLANSGAGGSGVVRLFYQASQVRTS